MWTLGSVHGNKSGLYALHEVNLGRGRRLRADTCRAVSTFGYVQHCPLLYHLLLIFEML